MKGGVDRVAFDLLPDQCGMLLSCSQGQFSFESEKLGPKGRGVFLHHVIEGLEGVAKDAKGNVTWDSLVAHVKLSVPSTVTDVFPGAAARQTPQQIANLAGSPLLATVSRVPSVRFITSAATGMKLMFITAGDFFRGSPASDQSAEPDEKPQHRVRITKDFYLGRTEVTQGEWKSVMGTEPWKGQANVKEGTDYPATHISPADAQEFCGKLSQFDGRTYRLPTEAEWEYAARGGQATRYSFGDDESQLGNYAWYGGPPGLGNVKNEKYAYQVGQKKANPFGLFDMHGNVWEWCEDGYNAREYAFFATEFLLDPKRSIGGQQDRVRRGGAWDVGARDARTANRHAAAPDGRGSSTGFRILTVRSAR